MITLQHDNIIVFLQPAKYQFAFAARRCVPRVAQKKPRVLPDFPTLGLPRTTTLILLTLVIAWLASVLAHQNMTLQKQTH